MKEYPSYDKINLIEFKDLESLNDYHKYSPKAEAIDILYTENINNNTDLKANEDNVNTILNSNTKEFSSSFNEVFIPKKENDEESDNFIKYDILCFYPTHNTIKNNSIDNVTKKEKIFIIEKKIKKGRKRKNFWKKEAYF